LYTLFAPLRWLGLSRERLAVRLALTLHYAEIAMLSDVKAWQDRLHSLFEHHGETGDRAKIDFQMCRFMFSDALLLGSAALLLVVTMQ
ncbi:MAG: hypothetical protein WA635_10615, partial [Gallionella sp.]